MSAGVAAYAYLEGVGVAGGNPLTLAAPLLPKFDQDAGGGTGALPVGMPELDFGKVGFVVAVAAGVPERDHPTHSFSVVRWNWPRFTARI